MSQRNKFELPPAGAKKTGVLVLHGLTGTSAELGLLVTQLHRSGYVVSAPHIDGLGDGAYINDDLRWRDWLTQARADYDALAERCETVNIVAFCVGALPAMKIASEKPAKLGRLVLLCPMLRADGWAIPLSLRLFDLVHARWLARYFTFAHRHPYGIKDERIRKMILGSVTAGDADPQDRLTVSGTKVLEFRRMSRHVLSCLAEVRAATLIIHAREDDKSAVGNATRIARGLAGPVELSVICDTYHIVTMDRQRHKVIARVVDYLDDAPVQSSARPVTSLPQAVAASR